MVTAAYHMPRSLLELGLVLPDSVLLAHPVFPPQVRLDSWWASPGTAVLVAKEFGKYLLSLARAGVRTAWAFLRPPGQP